MPANSRLLSDAYESALRAFLARPNRDVRSFGTRKLVLLMAFTASSSWATDISGFLGRYSVSRGMHLMSMAITKRHVMDLGANDAPKLRAQRYALRDGGPSFILVELLEGPLWFGCARYLKLTLIPNTENGIVLRGYATRTEATPGEDRYCAQDIMTKDLVTSGTDGQ